MNDPYPPGPVLADGPSVFDRIRMAFATARDTLDRGGRPLWFAAMIFGFVAAWPVGLGILFYMLWSKRMFGSCHAHRRHHHREAGFDRRPWKAFAGTGNTAFDAYREETLRRLEEEHAEFQSFLTRLREARDKAEFDQFMQQRQNRPDTQPQTPPAGDPQA